MAGKDSMGDHGRMQKTFIVTHTYTQTLRNTHVHPHQHKHPNTPVRHTPYPHTYITCNCFYTHAALYCSETPKQAHYCYQSQYNRGLSTGRETHLYSMFVIARLSVHRGDNAFRSIPTCCNQPISDTLSE